MGRICSGVRGIFEKYKGMEFKGRNRFLEGGRSVGLEVGGSLWFYEFRSESFFCY